jgi:hypothetical protein
MYMSHKWVTKSNTGTGPGSTSSLGFGSISGFNSTTAIYSAGGMAYRRRKQAVWEDFTKNADGIFRNVNPAYDSPS